MKSLTEILSEKLHISKTSKFMPGVEVQNIKIPRSNREESELYLNELWKEWEIPVGKYIIFKDPYRGDHAHFASFGDFLGNIIWCNEDFEDYNPEKDILFASNDIEETIQWYCDYLGITKEYEEFAGDINKADECCDVIDYKISKGTVDSSAFLGELICGKYDEEYFKNDDGYYIDLDKYDFSNIKEVTKILSDITNFTIVK